MHVTGVMQLVCGKNRSAIFLSKGQSKGSILAMICSDLRPALEYRIITVVGPNIAVG